MVFLHHPRKAVDYTNPVTHVRKISDHADGAVLRLGNGRWSTDPVRGLVLKHWEVMALDGDSFYTVGLLEAEDLRIEKRLRDTCEETKPATGAVAEVKGTFYVDVHLIHADYDDRGLRISGTIRALLPQVSKSDCADVTELEWLAGGDE